MEGSLKIPLISLPPRAFFDANIVIDYLNGNKNALDVLKIVEEKYISLIAYFEVIVGLPKEDIQKFQRFMEKHFSVVNPSANLAGLIYDLRRNEKLKLPDALIYAEAYGRDLPLITRNFKDFNPDWRSVIVPY